MLQSMRIEGSAQRIWFAPRYAELRDFAAKNFRAVENDRERFGGVCS